MCSPVLAHLLITLRISSRHPCAGLGPALVSQAIETNNKTCAFLNLKQPEYKNKGTFELAKETKKKKKPNTKREKIKPEQSPNKRLNFCLPEL